MKRKVYFCGSIRAGRGDAELYRRIIRHIQKTDIVLTEHVGLPALNLLEQGPDRDAEIYRQDMAWLRESDLVIAECSTPSLGVGYELARAQEFRIPSHILYDRSRTALSAMLTGDPYYHIFPYSSEDELMGLLDLILQDHGGTV